MKKFLEAGQIINKRGLRGEVKVDSYCDTLNVLCAISTLYYDDEGKKPVTVLSAKQYKGFVYMTLEGVTSVEEADKLRGKILYANRDNIPVKEGSIFVEDIIGLHVYDADNGTEYGTVTDVFNSGASDIYTVSKEGKDYYLPAVNEFVVNIDVEKGIFIRPIKGIFDDAEQV